MASSYVTVQGDMWDLISYKLYGDEKYMNVLIQANGHLVDTLVFSGGVEISVPDMPETVDDSLPFWRQ